MKKKLLTIVSTLFVYAIPVFCIVNGQPLTEVLGDLRSELKMAVEQSVEDQVLFEKDYDLQHQRMVDVITASNELSLLLYTQEQQMTFDLAYALEKVSTAYEDFSKDRKPYDRIVHEMNIEVDRYARLIEALRRLPPIKTEIEIEILPDRLLVFLFPPILALAIVRQLFFCLRESGKATPIDSVLGWISLTIVCISDLMERYKERWLDKRVDDMRNRITFVASSSSPCRCAYICPWTSSTLTTFTKRYSTSPSSSSSTRRDSRRCVSPAEASSAC